MSEVISKLATKKREAQMLVNNKMMAYRTTPSEKLLGTVNKYVVIGYLEGIKALVADSESLVKAQEQAFADAIAKAQAEADALKKIEEQKLADQMASAQAVMDKEKELREAQETPAQKEQREYEEWLAKYQENNLNTDLLEKEHQDFLNTQKADADALKLEKETKAEEDAKAKRDKQLQDEKDLEAQKLQVKLKALDDLQSIFGAEN